MHSAAESAALTRGWRGCRAGRRARRLRGLVRRRPLSRAPRRRGAPSRAIHCIDATGWACEPGSGKPARRRRDWPLRRAALSGGPALRWHLARSQDVGRSWTGGAIDLVFIDGDHSPRAAGRTGRCGSLTSRPGHGRLPRRPGRAPRGLRQPGPDPRSSARWQPRGADELRAAPLATARLDAARRGPAERPISATRPGTQPSARLAGDRAASPVEPVMALRRPLGAVAVDRVAAARRPTACGGGANAAAGSAPRPDRHDATRDADGPATHGDGRRRRRSLASRRRGPRDRGVVPGRVLTGPGCTAAGRRQRRCGGHADHRRSLHLRRRARHDLRARRSDGGRATVRDLDRDRRLAVRLLDRLPGSR